MASPPLFPMDVWGLLLNRLEPFLLVLLPCVCKELDGKFIVSNVTSFRLANDAALLPGMHPRTIFKLFLNLCKRHESLIRLSRLYVRTEFSLDNGDVQLLIKLAAPTLKSVKTSHSVGLDILLRLDASQLEELVIGRPSLRDAVSLVSSKQWTALRSIVIYCNSNQADSSKEILHILAKLSPPRLEKIQIHITSIADAFFPEICNVAKSHSQTLKQFSIECSLSMPWMNVKETCLELFNLPPHVIRVDGRCLLVMLLQTYEDDPLLWETIAPSLFDQIVAPIPSPRAQARLILRILREMPSHLFNRAMDMTPLLDWILPRLERLQLLNPDIVGRDLALKIAGVLASYSKMTGSHSHEMDQRVGRILDRFRADWRRIGSLTLRSSLRIDDHVVDHPFWRDVLLENLKSPQSLLRHIVVNGDISRFSLVSFAIERFGADCIDLWLQNEQGSTIVDLILVECHDTATQVLETILSVPHLHKQLFQRLSAAQVEKIYSLSWIYPSTYLGRAVIFPPRLFEIVEAANSDATLEAVFAFYYRWIRYHLAMEYDQEDVPLSEQKSLFLDLYRAAVPSRSQPTEKRFQRFLANENPFHTPGDRY